MKKILSITVIFTSLFFSAQKQASLEKSVSGVQIGVFGFDVYNEAKLSENTTLRSQLALYPSIWGGDLYSKTGFALAPAISLAPKYYYNLQKRKNAGKNTTNNSANFISAKLEYVPNWFVISNIKDIQVNEMISFIPTWGLRRNFATNFNYEFRIGLGVGKILQKEYSTQVAPDLSFKIGYDF